MTTATLWWSLPTPALWAAPGIFAAKVHMDLAIVDKRRQKANFCEVMNVIGDVKGKTCILFDDLVDTAGSLCNAAAALVEVGGAEKVYACASHGVLSGPALERVESDYIEELMVLNTIPMPAGYTGGKIKRWMWPPVRQGHQPGLHRDLHLQPVLMLFSKPSADWLIVGLGNPGRQYDRTRHNAGFRAMEALARRLGCPLDRVKFQGRMGQCAHGGQKLVLLLPQTFMNLSGNAVAEAVRFYRPPPERVLVLCDDISLEPGRLRVRGRGSAGGHNGLKSIIARLGSQDFPRVKIGVGAKPHPDYDLADWVLSTFSQQEEKALAPDLGPGRRGRPGGIDPGGGASCQSLQWCGQVVSQIPIKKRHITERGDSPLSALLRGRKCSSPAGRRL